MKKYILLCFILLLNMFALYAQEKKIMQVTLLNKEDSYAFYTAMKEFNETKKIEQIPDFNVTIRSGEQTIEVIFSEKQTDLKNTVRGGGGKMFLYTILKNNYEIKEIKKLLQR